MVLHSLLQLVRGEGHVLDVDGRRGNSINILIKLLSKLHDINAELLPIGVKLIGKVLDTGSDDILSNWEESILHSGVGYRM